MGVWWQIWVMGQWNLALGRYDFVYTFTYMIDEIPCAITLLKLLDLDFLFLEP